MSEVCVQIIDHLGLVSGMIEESGIREVLEERCCPYAVRIRKSHMQRQWQR